MRHQRFTINGASSLTMRLSCTDMEISISNIGRTDVDMEKEMEEGKEKEEGERKEKWKGKRKGKVKEKRNGM